MTARSKGAGYERRTRDILLALGYRIHQARPSLFWKDGRPVSFAYDLFKSFDFAAVHPVLPPLFVQVTSHENRAKRQRKVVVAVGGTEGNPHVRYEVWSFGKQAKLGFHVHIERLTTAGWSVVGNYKYDGMPVGPNDSSYTRLPSIPAPTDPTPLTNATE